MEIQNITWVSQLKIPSKIDLNKYISCLSTIFAIEKENNKEHGLASYWDQDGNLINTVEYFYGEIHGDWTRYYKSGNIESIIKYKFGNKDGYEITYYENGVMKSKVLHKDGTEVSEIIRWNNNGTLID